MGKTSFKVYQKKGKFPSPAVDTLVAQIDFKGEINDLPVIWCKDGYTIMGDVLREDSPSGNT